MVLSVLPYHGKLESEHVVHLFFRWKTYDGSYSSLMGVSESGAAGSAYHKDILNSWNGAPAGMTETSPNRIDPNGIPRIDYYKSSDLNATSDRWLVSSSYLVFKI